MKVLFVNTVPTEKNGITNVIFNLLSSFPKNGTEFGFVSISEPDGEYRDFLNKYGIRLYVIPRLMSRPHSYIGALAKLAKGYDVMHVHGNSATMVLEMIAAKLAGVKLRIAHSHNTTCTKKTIDKLARPLFYALCNGRMACGKEAGRWLFGNREFSVINNGINTARFRFNAVNRQKIRATLNCADKIVFGNVGNFVEQKNHLFLIEVFNEIVKLEPEAVLLLLGDGPLKSDIKDKIKTLGLTENVIFAGSVGNPEAYMSAMDLIIMPSLFEGLPLTLVEEQANGLHCLAADTITREADMTGNVSFLSLDDSPKEWAERALCLTTSSASSNKANQSEAAIIDITRNHYDINAISKELADYYMRALNHEK